MGLKTLCYNSNCCQKTDLGRKFDLGGNIDSGQKLRSSNHRILGTSKSHVQVLPLNFLVFFFKLIPELAILNVNICVILNSI